MDTASVTSSTTTPSTQAPANGAPTSRQPLTREQRDAVFAAAAATMQPARAPAAAELLEWRPQIMEYYAKGFSAVQIRDILQTANVSTSERVVQRFIAKYSHRKRATTPRHPDTCAATPAPASATEIPASRPSAATAAPAARQPAAKAKP